MWRWVATEWTEKRRILMVCRLNRIHHLLASCGYWMMGVWSVRICARNKKEVIGRIYRDGKIWQYYDIYFAIAHLTSNPHTHTHTPPSDIILSMRKNLHIKVLRRISASFIILNELHGNFGSNESAIIRNARVIERSFPPIAVIHMYLAYLITFSYHHIRACDVDIIDS